MSYKLGVLLCGGDPSAGVAEAGLLIRSQSKLHVCTVQKKKKLQKTVIVLNI